MGFKRVRRESRRRVWRDVSSLEGLYEHLEAEVVDRFHRVSGQQAIMAPVRGVSRDGESETPFLHPVCLGEPVGVECIGSWHVHMEEVERRPEPHWHRCARGNLCAVVPLVVSQHCLALFKVVCTDRYDEERFLQHVEVLDLLVNRFADNYRDRLSQVTGASGPNAVGRLVACVLQDEAPRAQALHPLILQVIAYIEDHLSEPGMSVASIAQDLGVNATYLAHLFSTQVGVRMSRYIGDLRVERAMELLATTGWQIKRVAYESGHGNADWFSQVFRVRAGMSPREYRRRHRDAGTGPSRGTRRSARSRQSS